jgi:hypothetical protein
MNPTDQQLSTRTRRGTQASQGWLHISPEPEPSLSHAADSPLRALLTPTLVRARTSERN